MDPKSILEANHKTTPLALRSTYYRLAFAGSVVMQPTQEMWVQSLGWEDFLKEEMATHSSILAWKIPWAEEPGRLQSTGSSRVGHDWVTECSRAGAHTHTHTHTHLPLQGLNHVLLQLLTFNTPWTEFRVESRSEALCAQGAKTGRTGPQIVGYFQE